MSEEIKDKNEKRTGSGDDYYEDEDDDDDNDCKC